jgi:hypothetical protein
LRNQLAQFAYLQLLDLMTTLLCMSHQSQETNPLVKLLIHFAGSPVVGLAVTKLLVFGVALYCWRRSREKLLWGVNLFYSAVVVWNLAVLLASHPR